MPDRNTETHWDKGDGAEWGTHLFDGVWARKCSKNEKIRFLTFLPRPHLSRSHHLPRCPGVTPSPVVPESPRSPVVPESPRSPVVPEFFGVPASSHFRSGFSSLPRQRTIPFPVWIRRMIKPLRGKRRGFLSHCHVMFRRRLTPRREKRGRSAHRRRASCHPS